MRRFAVRFPLVALSLIVVHVACGGSSSDGATPAPDDGADAGVEGEDVDGGDDGGGDATADAGAKCIYKSINPNAPAPCIGTTRKLGTRPYCLHVPSSYQPGQAMPLVVLLHGYSADGQHQATYFDFDTAAERHGFVLAKPDGMIDGLGAHYWNAFKSCCADPSDPAPPDDVAYLSDVVADIKGAFAIDAKRVYAVGHSNGGFMAHRLACDRAATFAAVVSVAGAVDPASCSPSEHISVLEVHGDADTIIKYGGGTTPGNTNPYPSVDTTLATWAQKNGCTGARGATGKLDILCESGFPGDETAVESYASCPAGIDVSLWRMHQGDHVPNFLVPWWGDRVWSFLEAHPKP